jgi:hypothetical protein
MRQRLSGVYLKVYYWFPGSKGSLAVCFLCTIEGLCVVVVVYLPSRHSFAHCFFISNEIRQVTAFKINYVTASLNSNNTRAG